MGFFQVAGKFDLAYTGIFALKYLSTELNIQGRHMPMKLLCETTWLSL